MLITTVGYKRRHNIITSQESTIFTHAQQYIYTPKDKTHQRNQEATLAGLNENI